MMAAMARTNAPGLHDLLHDMADLSSVPDLPVRGIATDSREVRAGYLFIARVYRDSNAIPYIDAAIESGAVAVVAEACYTNVAKDSRVPVLPVTNLQVVTGAIADRFYACPSRDLAVIGITGTNGKSSTAHILAQALGGLHAVPCGMIGTLGYGSIDDLRPGPNTTPEPVLLQHLLAGMRDENKRDVVMEVSSHGVEQHRITGVRFAAAVFTNLSQDHLDYHEDMQSYADVKRRLFTDYGIENVVINADDAIGREIINACSARHKVAYTLDPALKKSGLSDVEVVFGEIIKNDPGQVAIEITSPWGMGRLTTRLAGRFNAYNLLASMSALCLLGEPLPEVLKQLSRSRNIPGRMEMFGGGNRPVVYVDYAHSPDALEQVLLATREQCGGQLVCVFGCGGDRDRDKRPKMGRIAASLADRILLTSDNPRSEDPEKIIDAIAVGIDRKENIRREVDRKQAIMTAIGSANTGDIVVIAGKGHETYQEIDGERRPFSDQAVVLQALGEET
ncbi:MAG TPA: UDP-N-acetylmuramoyl-L-alanyl-D-glutamate--2,6-diaminopimelate ligase [Gammaproteobacteria bacterium]|nr:UDP-N-acetylmuramoyl-L-alanyl-D-glutamate--2,6-diaminopimelate ligase [Gammaproteobacteria bacterium]